MEIQNDEFTLEYNNRSQLSYLDNEEEYIELFLNDNTDECVGNLNVYSDSVEEDREYIIINYTIIYLDTIKKYKNAGAIIL